jgi:hypothetical protein
MTGSATKQSMLMDCFASLAMTDERTASYFFRIIASTLIGPPPEVAK